jgi:invasion protein IalB
MSDMSNQRLGAPLRSWREGKTGGLIWRIGSVVLLLLAGGLIAIGGERLLGTGGGSANETRVATFQDWRVVCPPLTPATPNCVLTQDVLRDTGGVLMTLNITDPAPNSTLSVTVPHGVALDSGIGFSIGNEPMRVRPYETCTNQGCIALVTMDADTLKSLRGNMGGQVVVAVPGNTSPVTIPFSLRGFGAGLDDLQRVRSSRTSIFSFLSR